MKLSILIPSIPSRLHLLGALTYKLQEQINALPGDQPVEVLALLDNKKRSIGLKRDALIQSARGEFLAFCDDDDSVSDDYVSEILKAIQIPSPTDVIVFDQHVILNDEPPFTVRFGIEYQNQQCRRDEEGRWLDITRRPFHVCVWRSELAKAVRMPDASYAEDWYWAKRVLRTVKSQHRIERVLHTYRFDDKVTEAAQVFPVDEEDKELGHL